MNDVRINNGEIQHIRDLMNSESVSIIWDLNAFYFDDDVTTYKLECFADLPEAGSDYDEIVYCRFIRLSERVEFRQSEPGFWYKIVSEAVKVEDVQIVDTFQIFPEESLIGADEISKHDEGVNRVSIGFLIKTSDGFLPAFVLPSNYGFDWHDKFSFYTEQEVMALLETKIRTFELRTARLPRYGSST